MADVTTAQWVITLFIFVMGCAGAVGMLVTVVGCVITKPTKRGPFKSIILCRLLGVVITVVFITYVVLPVYRVVNLILTMGGFL